MRKVATVIPDGEFQGELDRLKEQVGEWKNDGLGYVSLTCQLAGMVTLTAGTSRELSFTAGQLKQIFDLAK